jgi:hypothetical protein
LWILPCSLALAFNFPGPTIPAPPVPVPTPPVPSLPTPTISIPGLDLVRQQGPWIGTGLADAVTEVPFLDHYDPRILAPLAEMPCSPTGEFLVAPGAYDFFAQSYCLHAGSYAPHAGGEGYLYAPLTGPGATTATDIVNNSVAHPEIPQSTIQILLWALLSRTPFNDLSPELQQAGQALLSDQEIRGLTADPLIPSDLINQSFVGLPDPVQQTLDAEANLRDMFAGQVSDYTQIEGVAVLNGDPPPSKDSRQIPLGRWSYDPDGYFVAYVPYTYPATDIQVSCPADLTVQMDAAGRITSLQDARGDQITTQYAGDPVPLPGDAGVKVSTFSAVHLTAPDQRLPGGASTFDTANSGYVLTGLPSGKGRPDPLFSDRYKWSVNHRHEVEGLLVQVVKHSPKPVSASARAQTVARLVDLGNYAQALWEVLSAVPQQNNQPDLLLANPAYEAWQALVLDLGRGQPPQVTWVTPPPLGGLGLGLGLGFAGGLPSALAPLGTLVCGQNVSPLTPLHFGGSAAQPGDTGRQRLAQSSRGVGDDSEKPKPKRNQSTPAYQDSYANKGILSRGKAAMDAWAKLTSAGDLALGGPAMWIANQIGNAGDPRGPILGAIIDGVFQMAGAIGQALGGDPPRSDFDQVATPQPVSYQPYAPGAVVPAEKVQAINNLLAAATDLWSKLNAAQITRDRLGGAYLAKNQAGINRQASALVSLKVQCGQAMIVLANALQAFYALVPPDKAEPVITDDQLAALQADLRQNGFSPAVQQAHAALGLSAAEIEDIRQQELALTPADVDLYFTEKYQGDLAFAGVLQSEIATLREWGAMWTALPSTTAMVGQIPG